MRELFVTGQLLRLDGYGLNFYNDFTRRQYSFLGGTRLSICGSINGLGYLATSFLLATLLVRFNNSITRGAGRRSMFLVVCSNLLNVTLVLNWMCRFLISASTY